MASRGKKNIDAAFESSNRQAKNQAKDAEQIEEVPLPRGA
jgi:hypothetical protein